MKARNFSANRFSTDIQDYYYAIENHYVCFIRYLFLLMWVSLYPEGGNAMGALKFPFLSSYLQSLSYTISLIVSFAFLTGPLCMLDTLNIICIFNISPLCIIYLYYIK